MIELLSEEDKAVLQKNSLTIHFPKGEIITREATPINQIHIITDGLVKISKIGASNRPVIIRLLKKGNFIGLSALFNGKVNQTTAIALTETTVQLFHTDAFFTIYQRNNAFNHEITQKIAASNKFLIQQLIDRSIKRLPGRVADTILYLHTLNDQQLSFELPLSRAEMAQLANTTKESLIRTLGEFKHDKIISLDDRKITINSLDIIKTLSRFG